MKIKVMKEVEIEVKKVVIEFCPRYLDEEESAFHKSKDTPMFDGNKVSITFSPETGVIFGWPDSKPVSIYEKICDEGTYILLDENNNEVAAIRENHVPSVVPNEFGDYISLEINDMGKITNFIPNPDFSDFFESED